MNNLLAIYNQLLGFTVATLTVFAYITFRQIREIFAQRRRRKVYPSIIKGDSKDFCKGPHKWNYMKVALVGMEVKEHTICTECGFICGSKNHQLNKPGMEVYLNNLKIRQAAEDKYALTVQKKQIELDDLMNSLIRRQIQNFEGDTHKNIKELQQFFRKSIIEIDSLYAKLNRELEEKDRG